MNNYSYLLIIWQPAAELRVARSKSRTTEKTFIPYFLLALNSRSCSEQCSVNTSKNTKRHNVFIFSANHLVSCGRVIARSSVTDSKFQIARDMTWWRYFILHK